MDAPSPLGPRIFHVPPALAGERLDRALVSLVPGVSRTRLQELIRDGGVRVAGEPVLRGSLLVEAEQPIELLEVPRSRERRGGPATGDLHVVHEDEHLAVIDKPPGVVSHPSEIVRGGTVADLAAERWEGLPVLQGEERPGIVHRLDAGTSGLMVLAKDAATAAALVAQFRERQVAKTYLALVYGEPRFDSDWIEAALCRAPSRADRMAVADDPPDEDDAAGEVRRAPGPRWEASTFYETRERLAGFALVTCSPRTGRTHQIRVHMTSIGHPLVGDRVYRGRQGQSRPLPPDAPPIARQALHAQALEFTHPATGERRRFEVEPPSDFADLLAWLRGRARQ